MTYHTGQADDGQWKEGKRHGEGTLIQPRALRM